MASGGAYVVLPEAVRWGGGGAPRPRPRPLSPVDVALPRGGARRVHLDLARYEPTRLLGSGMYGVVLQARDCATGRSVAIKCINGAVVDEGAANGRRVAREVYAMLCLGGCRRCLPLLDAWAGARPGDVYFVMPALRRDAAALLEDAAPLPPAAALGIAADLLEALAHMHAAGLLHRDVKPHNVLLDEHGGARLGDYNLVAPLPPPPAAAAGGRPRALSFTVFSTGHRPPEVVCGAAYGAAADVWSAGVVLFSLLQRDAPRLPLLSQQEDAFCGAVAAGELLAALGPPSVAAVRAYAATRDAAAWCGDDRAASEQALAALTDAARRGAAWQRADVERRLAAQLPPGAPAVALLARMLAYDVAERPTAAAAAAELRRVAGQAASGGCGCGHVRSEQAMLRLDAACPPAYATGERMAAQLLAALAQSAQAVR
jgi:serine/threonine protein kinase